MARYPGDLEKSPSDSSDLNANLIEAYSVTLAHHAEVVRLFAVNFVNVFALYNAGAFAAFVATLPTDLGRWSLEHHQYICYWIIVLFAAGFFGSVSLMAVLFGFSLRKYRHYRDILKTANYSAPPNDRQWFHTVAYLLLVAVAASTIVGTILVLVIIWLK